MSPVARFLPASIVFLVAAADATAGPPIRALAADGNACWAAGDAGLVLRSDDRGATWRRVDVNAHGDDQGRPCPAYAAGTCWQAISLAGRTVAIFGGTAQPGHPAARGTGAVTVSTDGGATWRALPAPPGWLYGGAMAGQTGVVLGEATGAAPGGIWHSVDGGRRWTPAALSSAGFALAGDFRGPRYGWAVGQDLRIVSLRGRGEPPVHPSALAGEGSFRAARFVDEITCWAVGDNAAVYRSAGGERPWRRVPSPLPPAGRRLGHLEAIAVAARIDANGPPRIWAAGGLVNVIARTDDLGGTWTLLKSPAIPEGTEPGRVAPVANKEGTAHLAFPPVANKEGTAHLASPAPARPCVAPGRGAAVHALCALDANTVLAAGDGGAIWRSADGGASWSLAAGTPGVDVLFVAAAGDASVYPAAVAHALAGDAVGMLYATVAPASAGVPGDQPLRAAAGAAGASAVAAFGEFGSIAWDASAAELTDRELTQRWSAALDIPAEAEMVRRIAAAIRLYGPAVLAVGPDGAGPLGRRGENRLVARLARQAAQLATRDDQDVLESLGLRPHAVRRVFVGLEANEKYAPPWEDGPKIDRREATATFDGSRFAGGRRVPLELLAAEAAWHLPEADLVDRPAVVTAYRLADERLRADGTPPLKLFTAGLTPASLATSAGEGEAALLAASATLRLAAQRGETHAAAIGLAATLDKTDDPNMQALATDRLLLASRRLMEEGRLLEADAALRAVVRRSRPHGMARRAELTALAAAASSEWQTQLRRQGVPERLAPDTLTKAAGGLDRFPAWAGEAEVRVLQARALAAGGDAVEPEKIFEALAGPAFAEVWRVMALSELGRAAPAGVPLPERPSAIAATTAEAGRLDGALDEAVWRTAPRMPLQQRPDANSDKPATAPDNVPVVQVVRAAGGSVIFGLALPAGDGRDWSVEVAIDADRDAWTQLVLRCDTRGQRSAELAFRGGPAAKLDARLLPLQAQREKNRFTLELAVPISAVSARADVAAAWAVQIRATRDDAAGPNVYYWTPQGDGRLLPERYMLVILPATVPSR
jgi:photosystem II stability/assembly factor-like uncharacterized protein